MNQKFRMFRIFILDFHFGFSDVDVSKEFLMLGSGSVECRVQVRFKGGVQGRIGWKVGSKI